ncbi:glycosyltransferase [uncultured Selenomonas sp.]|uniref:glycosyltransferase n=1 Tax=uncultured Selenomonas sp. TaxID=159275 RepID=UPI0025CC69C8|nr:glycosyltransferase [uncultured Selenomonas sp.]
MHITACYITKNEERTLARSVASIRGAYDDLLVVDTGSTDGTVGLAKRLGARVVPFSWRDDFSAARNAALEAATGDIILFLDADEYVSAATAQHVRRVLEEAFAEGVDALLFHLVNIDGDEAQSMGDAYVLRAFRRTARLRYAGRIHEELRDDGQDVVRLKMVPDDDIRLYHTGYESTVNRAKAERNLHMLQAELAAAEQAQDTAAAGRLYMYLAEAYRGVGDYVHAEEFARRDIAQGRRPVVDASRSYHLLLSLLAKASARSEERLEVAEEAVRDFPELPEFHAELAVLRAEALDLAGAVREMTAALACCDEPRGLEPDRFDDAMRAQAEQAITHWRQQLAAASSLSVTTCLITNGQAAGLADWFRRAAIFSDAILVVDTGAPEGMIARAAQEGGAAGRVTVVPFAWRDDFAAARNAALDRAQDGAWIVFPDDDEFFQHPEQVRTAIVRAQARDPEMQGLQANIINVDEDADDLEIGRFPALRVWQQRAGRRYAGAIHEVLLDRGAPVAHQCYERCLTIRHTGYSSDRMTQKLERNLRMLYMRMAAEGETPMIDRYLADCLYGLGQYELAIPFAEKAIAAHVATVEGDLPLYGAWLRSLKKLGRPLAEQQRVAEQAAQAYPEAAEPDGWRGLLALSAGDRGGAERHLHAFLAKLGNGRTGGDGGHAMEATVRSALAELLSERAPARAEAYLRQALALDPYDEATLARAARLVAQERTSAGMQEVAQEQTSAGAQEASQDRTTTGASAATAFYALVLPCYRNVRRGLSYLTAWAEKAGREDLYVEGNRRLAALQAPQDALAAIHAAAASGDHQAYHDALLGRATLYTQELFAALVELTASTDRTRRVPETRRAEWTAHLPEGFQRILTRLAGGTEPLLLAEAEAFETGRKAIEGFVSEEALARYEALREDFLRDKCH